MKETSDGKPLKSSKSFFTQLDESSTMAGRAVATKKKKKSLENGQLSAKRLKL